MNHFERDLIRNILLSANDDFRAKEERFDGVRSELYGYISKIFPVAQRQTLEAILPSGGRDRGNLLDSNQFLYLPPIEKGNIALPVASFRFSFTGNNPEFRIQVGLVQKKLSEDSEEQSEFFVLGLRFETPEGEGGGRHDFYHSQVIRGFSRAGHLLNPSDSVLAHLNEDQPSFPLVANCPVTLTLAFFVALYGAEYLKEIVANVNIPSKYLRHIHA